jgi:hypothetical protein
MGDRMGGEFEALGDVVTGALVGRALEPTAGEGVAEDGHTHETSCLNCKTPLVGDFCHACGQHAHVHKTLRAFFHDFVNGILNFEGKIWRTLPLLAWKPGALTRRYIDGQRATFVSPVALFLFCVFLMFAAVSLLGGGIGDFSSIAKEDIGQELKADRQKLATFEAARADAAKAGQKTAKWDEKITDLRAEITAMEAVRNGNLSKSAVQVSDDTPGWLRDRLQTAAKDPDLVAYKLQDNASKYSWMIIPLSVPFVWLLFPFSRRFKLYDHTVFVTYSLCFMSLLVVAGVVFQSVGLTVIAGLLWLIPPFHIYRQLKGAYGLSRGGALWRTMILTVFALIVVALFAALVVGVGTFD